MNAPHDLSTRGALRPLPAAMLEALRSRFGERCSTAAAVREQHGRGESVYDAAPPEVVVFCENTEDVAAIVTLANLHAVVEPDELIELAARVLAHPGLVSTRLEDA